MFRRALYAGIFLAALLGAQNPATTVTVDAAANRHAINPNIYGVAYCDATTLPDLNVPLNRYGGNNTSRYNWQINADNRCAPEKLDTREGWRCSNVLLMLRHPCCPCRRAE
jgi:hypothetical protein